MDLEAYRIEDLPEDAFYLPDFITPDEETELLQQIHAQPLPKWRTLAHRRLQAHPSPLSPTNVLLDAPLPVWLETIVPRLKGLEVASTPLFAHTNHQRPNHCLINEYRPGQGILPHEDGDAYDPIVCTVSLGSHTVLDLLPKGGNVRHRILQEQRSLLVTTSDLYRCYLHGIADVEVDRNLQMTANWSMIGRQEDFLRLDSQAEAVRQTRISLTFRDVKKVKTFSRALRSLMK